MPHIDSEPVILEFRKAVAAMREREAPEIEIQSMLDYVEQLIRWRPYQDHAQVVGALREAARDPLIDRVPDFFGSPLDRHSKNGRA
jgi:hypothetical protein